MHSSRVQPEHLLSAARSGDDAARAALLEFELPLVRKIAVRYRGAGLPYDDLVQEGSIGLLEAIERFDTRYGVEFESYARFRVHRAIRNALTERARLVRLPKHVVERRRLIERESARLFASTGHTPTSVELAEQTGLQPDCIRAAVDAAIDAVSLDEPATPNGSPLQELVADPAASDPETALVERDEMARVDAAVEHLPPRQRHIVEEAFGFGTAQESIADIAAEHHLSAQRTRAIMLDALYKLREELETMATIGVMFLTRF
jgi:RNA polymerase primary sigma factor